MIVFCFFLKNDDMHEKNEAVEHIAQPKIGTELN